VPWVTLALIWPNGIVVPWAILAIMLAEAIVRQFVSLITSFSIFAQQYVSTVGPHTRA
jgi:hypothetical protein